ncbi:LPD1 domain-containing protein [Marinobacterium stanieri]|uniref:Large polyvalent protein-associated domain-containing protein n=1 Tax=Marinobacterium stanieri TaxID=49186 RepID=A0A1N6X941_9GAMM|nr:LPD1 domain-containing protein [Marinobacterium stanieri]SIQ98865.1 hypothetical protein SAMN05421647_11325 [Marinobacterium stanieri]
MQMIETPILNISYGIECRPLILKSQDRALTGFVLEHVPDEVAATLPTGMFVRIGEGRFMSVSQIDMAGWQSLFPGTQSHYQEPTVVNAGYTGKKITVPGIVSDRIKQLTDEQLQVITAGHIEYVSSIEVCRYSALQGMLDKSYVPPVLETAARQVIDRNPAALDAIAFLNRLLAALNRDEHHEVDVAQVFDLMIERDAYDDADLYDVLPNDLARSDRDFVRIDRLTCTLASLFVTTGRLKFLPFESISDLYTYVCREGYLTPCHPDQGVLLDRSLEEYSWIRRNQVEFDELQKRVTPNQSGRVITYQNHRLFVSPHGKAFQFIDAESRRIWRVDETGTHEQKVSLSDWIYMENADEPNAVNTLLNAISDDATDPPDVEGDASKPANPDDRYAEFINAASAYEKRIALNQAISDRLFIEPGSLAVFHKRLLAELLEVAGGTFIRSKGARPGFWSAITVLHTVIESSPGESWKDFILGVRQGLMEMGLTQGIQFGSVNTLLTSEGKVWLQELAGSALSDQQRFLRIIYDDQHEGSYLLSDGLFRALGGYQIQNKGLGWSGFRDGMAVTPSFERRELLERYLQERVNISRVHLLVDPGSGTEDYWYLGPAGKRYLLPGYQEGQDPRECVSAALHRPSKRKFTFPWSSEPLSSIGITEYQALDDDEQEPMLSAAFVQLLECTGIQPAMFGFSGELGLHVAGKGEHINLAMWNSTDHVVTGLGGLAAAWGELLYRSLVPESVGTLYFPAVEHPALAELLACIGYQSVRYRPTHTLSAGGDVLESELLGFIGQASLFPIHTLDPVEFEDLCNEVHATGVNDSVKLEWIRSAKCLRDNWQLIDRNVEYAGLTAYLKNSRLLSLQEGNDALCRGASLFSRAFEAYVEDCLNDHGVVNDLLVLGAKNSDRMGVKLYPEGAERYRIKRAFDEFITYVM